MPSKLEYKLGESLDTDGLKLMRGGEEITTGFICDPCVLTEVGTQQITVRYGRAATSFQITVKEESNDASPENGDTDTTDGGEQDQSGDAAPKMVIVIIVIVTVCVVLSAGIAIVVIKKRQ